MSADYNDNFSDPIPVGKTISKIACLDVQGHSIEITRNTDDIIFIEMSGAKSGSHMVGMSADIAVELHRLLGYILDTMNRETRGPSAD